MLPLNQALQDHELIVLRVIGEWWELDLTGSDKPASIRAVAEALSQIDMPTEVQYLAPEEIEAVQTLVSHNGRVPSATFKRAFGDVRMMGPAALEREEPWFDPASVTESLWYRGFVYKGFSDEGDGLVEVFYLPNELLEQFPAENQATNQPVETFSDEVIVPTTDMTANDLPSTSPLSPQTSAVRVMQPTFEPEIYTAETTDAVDDITTLLAMAQVGKLSAKEQNNIALEPYLLDPNLKRLGLLKRLGVEMGMLRQGGGQLKPTRTAVTWLQESREAQIRALAEAWSGSSWNELHHVPEIICEGSGWSNDPIAARSALLDALTLTTDWFTIEQLVTFVYDQTPDFQRPNGNYDTWYIRDVATNQYIRGFENWALVEGRLLHYLITHPMSWLGLVESDGIRFRLTTRSIAWLNDEKFQHKDVPIPIVVQNDASILVAHNTDRYQRFQTARIANMAPATKGKPFTYHITPHTLDEASRQKITPDRVLQFLANASGRPIPNTTKRAIERWSENGTEGQVDTAVILRVRDAEILTKLRQHPKARPLIGEQLGELAAVVQANNWRELCSVAAQLGLLLDTPH